MERRNRIVESALQVVADQGLKGLSHRVVDRHAGLVEGSTGNYFPRRNDLIHALLVHLEARDRHVFRQARGEAVSTLGELAGLLARGVDRMISDENFTLTRVRLALMPATPARSGEMHRGFLGSLEVAIERAGGDNAEARARTVVDYFDGVVLHYVTVDPRPLAVKDLERVFYVLLTA